MITMLEEVVRIVEGQQVQYILIGGWAAAIHGSARSTVDVDLIYARDHENIRRLAQATAAVLELGRGRRYGLPVRYFGKTDPVEAGRGQTKRSRSDSGIAEKRHSKTPE